MSTSPARPIYLDVEPDAVFGYHHPAAGEAPSGTAVLICPPFGWDDVCSYRARRDWAGRLAGDGYPTLRIDLPGSGDSAGSPHDPDRLGAWLAATAAAAAWLRAETGARRLVAIGVGLGGFVATLAASHGAPIDDLVLWGVPGRGRTLVRELRAFAQLNALEGADDSGIEAPGDVAFAANGFVLTHETAEALSAVDLAAGSLSDGPQRRILLLERDGVSVDSKLRAFAEAAGAEVTVLPGEGYGDMIKTPQQSRSPEAVFGEVADWLARSPHRSATQVDPPAVVAREALELDGWRETPLLVDTGGPGLSGILTEPLGAPVTDTALVMMNAGAIRRAGPSRMWVELARGLAAQGLPVLRLDIEGVGDSDGPEQMYTEDAAFYDTELVRQVRAALDELEARGIGRRFIVGGLCSGAYWTFHSLLADPRIHTGLSVNMFCFFWESQLSDERELPVAGTLLSRRFWARLLRGRLNMYRVRKFARWLVRTPLELPARIRGRRSRGDRVEQALSALDAEGQRIFLMLGRDEPLLERLTREGQLDRLTSHASLELHRIPGSDHTLRPLGLQKYVHNQLTRVILESLETTRPGEGRDQRAIGAGTEAV
jgi:pimeloyl-ACP methyl ester carboxylesterase